MTTSRLWTSRRRRSRRASQRGAAAVELAFCLPVLAAMLFGIVDYGLWFNDSLSVRDGVREAARVAVVKNWTADPACTGTGMATVACVARESSHPLTGDAYAKVFAPDGWVKGKSIVVCGMVKAEGATGFFPLPDDGFVSSSTRMSIENVAVGGETYPAYTDTPPSGAPAWNEVEGCS